MGRSTPVLRAGVLIIEPSGVGKRTEIHVESDAWFRWLQGARAFSFDDATGRFTARKKRRRGADYWYALRRYSGSLYETYLGKTADMTLRRLRSASARLSELAERGRLAHAESASSARQSSPITSAMGGTVEASDTRPSTAAIVAPEIPREMPRTRLIPTHSLERMRLAPLYPLTVLSAPAGYGKTALLAQWSKTTQLTTAWLTLRTRDNDPARFWRRIVEALAPLVPDLVFALRAPEGATTAQTDVTLTTIINALPSAPSPIALILDNYHEVRPDNADIHTSIAELVAHLPPQAHLALASRTAPPLPLTKLRAQRRVLELHAADLALTLSEAAVFLRQLAHVALSDEQIAILHERTEGWVTGLQLAALSLREHTDIARWIYEFSGENRSIYDYFIEEVVDLLPSELRAFALHVAPLDRFSALLCDAVTRSSESEALLDELDRANLFLVSLDDRREWYRFHHLFADALRRYLRLKQPSLTLATYHRASQWCRSHSLTREAIDYAFAAREPARAARLLEDYLPSALAGPAQTLVANWLNQLPNALVRERPRLCMAQAYLLMTSGGERTLIRQRLRDAEKSLALAGRTLGPARSAALRREIQIVSSGIRFLLGDIPPRTSLDLRKQTLVALPSQHALTSFTRLCIGIEQLAGGDTGAAYRTLYALWRASDTRSDTFETRMSLLYLGLALLRLRRLDDALARCDLPQRQGIQHNERIVACARLISGTVYYERNQLDRALDTLSSGIATRNDDPAVFLLGAYPTLAYVHLAMGNGEDAQQTIEQGLAVWTKEQTGNALISPWTGKELLAHQARLDLLAGRVGAASDWARQLEAEMRGAGSSRGQTPACVREWEETVLARTYLAERRAHEAVELLRKLDDAAEATGRTERLLEILVLQVVAHDANGDIPAAWRALQRAIALAAPQRVICAFVEGGPTIQRFLRGLQTEHAPGSSGGRWLRKRSPRRFVESILNAFALQGQSGVRDRRRRAAATTGNRSAPQPASPRLTRRQRQILHLVEDGATNQDIARDLVISPATVKRHMSNIFTQMGVTNRTKAVTRALELGLLAPEVETEPTADADW